MPTTGFCQLRSNDTSLPPNDRNQYGHNFDGLYCWCNQPYDHNSSVIMIQCDICQDCFHQECIEKETKQPVPITVDDSSSEQEDKTEFVCRDCISKYYVLQYYSDLVYNSDVVKQKSDPQTSQCLVEGRSTTVFVKYFSYHERLR